MKHNTAQHPPISHVLVLQHAPHDASKAAHVLTKAPNTTAIQRTQWHVAQDRVGHPGFNQVMSGVLYIVSYAYAYAF